MELFGIEMSFKEWNNLMVEQSQGKDLKVIDGKVVAVEPQPQPIDYEQLVVSKIRERYTIDQELAILRQRDTKPQEFAEYNAYVENCKSQAKEEV